MFDLYLFNTIINTIWYLFTILFVLYKFTSFFSYMYNFVKFCGKIFTWIKYLYDQIIIYLQKKKGYKYTLLNDLESQTTSQNKTYFQKIKDNIWKSYVKFKLYLGFRHIQRPSERNYEIPLTETISNSNIKNESYYNSSEKLYFNNTIDDLDESSLLFEYLNNENNKDNNESSEIPFNLQNSINISDNFNFNESNDNFNKSNDNFNFNQSKNNMLNLSKYNSNTYNIDSHTSILNTFIKKPTSNTYNINNSNLLFESDFIFNTVTKSKRQNENEPHLFEFQNNNNDKKIKLDNLSNSISFTGENIKTDHVFDKEINKNPYI